MDHRHVDLVGEEDGRQFLLDTLALAETALAELEESYRRRLSDAKAGAARVLAGSTVPDSGHSDVDADRAALASLLVAVATTLHNLALLYEAEGRSTESAALWAEAQALLGSAPLMRGTP